MRRRQPRGQSVAAVRCAMLSTLALAGAAVAQGTLGALLAFGWVLGLIAALALEWRARRRVREVPAPPASEQEAARRRRPGASAST